MLPLWVLGFWLYKYGARLAERVPLARTLLVLSSVAIMAFPQFPSFAALTNFGAYFPWGHGPFNRNLLLDYATAFAFAVQMVAARRVFSHMHAPRRRDRDSNALAWMARRDDLPCMRCTIRRCACSPC